ncbi:MAG: TonB-dependent receptor plug domain-containing protein, partial [Bacteroidaceae bacterium]|nr:TonB-dependent receptor plug domain-containing protein [Bacteroidaceae bacterium]
MLVTAWVAWAQTDADIDVDVDIDSISMHTLNEVIVTANRFTEVIPSQKLTGKELEGLNSLSVADALRYFSGVQLKDYGGVGGIKTVNIRGMGSEQMGVYYNGIQLGNAQNGQVDLGKFSLENIEEISLYNGQRSDVFQTAREFGSAGSIYLTTRRPRFKEGARANLKAGLKVGSFDFLSPSILCEYKITDDIFATFNAEWINSSGKYEFRYRRVTPAGEVAYDTTAIRENGDIDAVRIEGGVQGYMPRGKWKAYMYHYTSERGIPGAIVNNVWHRGERLWDRNSFVQAMFEYDITPKLSTKVNAKYAFDYTHYVNNDDKLIHVDNIYKQREVYASWANKYTILRNWDVSLAYDYQWNQLSEYRDVQRNTHWVSLASAYALGDCFKVQASALATI